MRYYGWYSSLSRARRRRAEDDAQIHEEDQDSPSPEPPSSDPIPSSAEKKRLRRKWAQLIRRIYEADPLLCECGQKMRVLSVLTDQPVIDKILAHLDRKREGRERAPPEEPPDRSSLSS